MASEAQERHHRYEPDYAVPPGENLAEVLERMNMSQAELAVRTDLSTKHVNQVIKGVASLSTETSLALERVTKIPARVWDSLETSYRSQKTRLEEKEKLKGEVGWLDEVPLRELVKRGYIEKVDDRLDQLQKVYEFFGVVNRKSWEVLWRSTAYRRSQVFESDPVVVSSWLRIGEIEAMNISTVPFNRAAFQSALKKIRRMTEAPSLKDVLPDVQRLCAEAGVAVVVEPEISGARVVGAARWLTPDKALIVLSGRYRWSDVFWFTFFHEAAHILRHSKRETFIDDKRPRERDASEIDEKEADAFAARWLIPRELEWELAQIRTDLEVREFAKRAGISPAVVVGRLHHEKRWSHRRGNHLRHRYDPHEVEALLAKVSPRSGGLDR